MRDVEIIHSCLDKPSKDSLVDNESQESTDDEDGREDSETVGNWSVHNIT